LVSIPEAFYPKIPVFAISFDFLFDLESIIVRRWRLSHKESLWKGTFIFEGKKGGGLWSKEGSKGSGRHAK